MIFLNGILLGLLAAAGIPLLIHLLNPRRRRPSPLSTTRFLRAIQASHLRRLRLTRWLLLLLRMLILALLVLSFARPAHRLEGLGSRTGLHAVLLLDNSLSTQLPLEKGRALDQLRDRARRLLAAAEEEDRFSIVRLARPAALLGTPSMTSAEALEVLAGLEASDAADDLDGALRLAHGLLPPSDLLRELHLFSDGRTGLALDSLLFDEGLGCWLHAPATAVESPAGFAPPRIRSGLLRQGQPQRWSVDLTSWPPDRLEATPALQLRHGEELWISQPLERESRQVEIRFPTPAAGVWPLELSLEGLNERALAWRTVLRVPPAIRVLLLDNGEACQPALRAALAPDSSYRMGLELQAYDSRELASVDLENWDALVAPLDASRPSAGLPRTLRRAREAGLGLFLLPSGEGGLHLMEECLQVLELPASVSLETGSGRRLEFMDHPHPVFEGLLKEGHALPSLGVDRLLKRPQAGEARTLLGLRGQLPLLSAMEGGRRLLLLHSSPEDSWSDLAESGLFAPLMQRGMRWLALGRAADAPVLVCGESAAWPAGSRWIGRSAAGLRLEGPEETFVLPPPANRGPLPLPALDRSGFYRLRNTKGEEQLLAVNPALEDLRRAPLQLEALVRESGLPFEVAPKDPQELAEGRRGGELWRHLLLLALALLLLEQLTAGRSPGGKEENA